MIEKFKAIEGVASDVRQARSAIISNSGFIVAWGTSYECLFRLSDTPVALRVSDSIFIENGDTVKVVGRHNWNGVFDAVAYHNRSSRTSGNSSETSVAKFVTLGIAGVGGIMVFLVAPVTSLLFRGNLLFADPLSLVFALAGLPFLLVGGILFARYQSEIRTIAKLLNDA